MARPIKHDSRFSDYHRPDQAHESVVIMSDHRRLSGSLRKFKRKPKLSRFSGVILSVLVAAALIGCGLKPASNGPASNGASQSPSSASGEHKNLISSIRKRGYLIMGVQASAPPMNYSPDTDPWDEAHETPNEEERRLKELSWRREGFDFELARMIMDEMGFIHKRASVKAREVKEYKDLFSLIDRREADGSFSVDIIMSGMAPDHGYDETISWTNKYLEVGYALITKKDSPINSLSDCAGKRIGVVAGDNIVKAYVSAQLASAKLVELSDESDEWLSDGLNLNQVDAVVYDYPFAVEEVKGINEVAKQKGVMDNALEIRVARLPNSNLEYSIGVPKGEEDFLQLLNDAIAKVTAEDNPRYAALIRKYLSSTDVRKITIPSGARVYIVRRGDSLARIAAQELGDENRWRELGALNNIGNDHLIVPNQKLILPQ